MGRNEATTSQVCYFADRLRHFECQQTENLTECECGEFLCSEHRRYCSGCERVMCMDCYEGHLEYCGPVADPYDEYEDRELRQGKAGAA